jgi:putative peptide zinc metalloprotease protein
MTATASTISGPVVADSERRPDRALATELNGAAANEAAVPAHAAGVELLGNVAGSGYRRAPALVRRGDGQTIQLTPLLFHLLEAIDGKRSHVELATTLGDRIGKLVTTDDVRYLVEAKLRPLGVLRAPDGAEPTVTKSNPLLALRLKLIVSNPELTRRLTAPFAAFFHPLIVAAVATAFAVTTWWLVFEKGLASAAHQAIYEPSFLLLVFGLTVLSAGFHEIGHAAACRYAGARPGAMGVGLYLVWPAFYTDVTDSYRLGRRDRLRVDLGGLYFNAIFGVGMVAVWAATRWDALLLVVAAQLIQMARQLVPVVRFDGYHVLADLVGVPDLFAHIKPTLLGLLPTHWGRAEGKALKTWARTVVTLWVLVVVPLLAALLALLVVVLPRIVATAWDSLGLHWANLEASWADANVAAVAVALVSMLTICLPLIGIPYLLVRVLRRTTEGVWRATAGRPPLRIGAALAGAVLVVGVAWTWWPDGQYRPIESSERWQLPEVPQLASAPDRAPEAAFIPPVGEVTAAAPAAPSVGAPSAPVGTTRRAQWAIVLVPHGTANTTEISLGSAIVPPEALPGPEPEETDPPVVPSEPEPVPEPDAPAAPSPTGAPPTPSDGTGARPDWPFPFAPPREPEEGDNQALAVNTEDGSTKVDVALALVWVTDGGPVEQRNEAYALASCRDCRTVAIAFQVVLVIGYAQIVTPINAAVAVNYACEACATHALAVQLVATLTREPSEETMNAIAAILDELEERSASFEQLPLGQVYEDLLEARTRTLEILATESTEIGTETSTTDDGTETQDPADTPAAPADEPGTTTEATTTTTAEPATSTEEAVTTTTETNADASTPPAEDPGAPPPPPEETTEENGTVEDPPPEDPAGDDPPAETEPPQEPSPPPPPDEPTPPTPPTP